MTKKRNIQNEKPGLGYRIFKKYVGFFHDHVYYRKVYAVNTENIPEKCPLMIVSNHQNSLCDPLGLLLTVKGRRERKHKVITRADVFNKPLANRLLRWLGLLPAYRMSVDGEESLVHNTDTFEVSEEELLNDGTIIIFPESGHQDKRWLGKFSSGYLHILFEAARKSDFKKELFVLPSCNHYSNYFDIQEDMVIKYGTPISIAPFYELYKTKPRTAQRQVNALVRQQVSDLMLNITDLDNYKAIDYLRNTYGVKYAKSKGLNPTKLPEKLLADKQLFADLEHLKEKDDHLVQQIYRDTLTLGEKIKQLRLNDWNFDRKYNPWKMLSKGVLFALLFPLFIFSLIPNILVLYAPGMVTSKVKDPMLHSAIKIVISLLFTMPVLYLSIFAITWMLTNSFLIASIYVFCLPFLGVFVWHYAKTWKAWLSEFRFHKLSKNKKLDDLISLRTNLYESLDTSLGIRSKPIVRNLYERFIQPWLRARKSS
ncbi:MAG: 1-acyl-sn-glycerol-3-phosphate acyltransferase [Bacteroidales bacterium]|jgi:1-acyl-sn-glycerol-3-phosphate acyltransferase|nr:1-acyl-sn-glycerol-3-phosphate acyltransferase [Bacteroidales bacterium]